MRKLAMGAALLAALLCMGAGSAARPPAVPVHSGPELDYQPAFIRVEPSGALLMIIERLNPQTLSGDLYQTVSTDNGATWAEPTAAITGTVNQRHPALVQLGPQSFALFYLSSVLGGGYEIHRATSADGQSWTNRGPIDLGWEGGGEINPSVIREPDGTLTMVYQHLSANRSYASQSADGGATWDRRKIAIADGARLPRIARRDSDGRYLVAYQVNVGGDQLRLYAKISDDALAWPAEAQPLSTAANSHDAQPIVLEDGRFLVSYIRQQGGAPFNVFYRASADGLAWNEPTQVTFDQTQGNVQPHPLPQGARGKILLTWSHEIGAGDQDIMIDEIVVTTSVYLPLALR